MHLGKALDFQARFEEALQLYREAEARQPDNMEALLRQGFVLFMSGDAENGNAMMEKALELAPDLQPAFVRNLEELGSRYVEMEKPELAAKLYQVLMLCEPENNWYKVYYADALAALGNDDEASQLLQKVIEQFPESPWTAYKLEDILRRKEQPEVWLATWKSLHEKHPDAYIPATLLWQGA